MSILKQTFLFLPFSFATFFTMAGTPVNGTTMFNSVSAGVKAIGSAGSGAGITASNIQGFDFNLKTVNAAPTMVIEVWDGAVSSGNGVAFYEETSSINPLFSSITISANDGALFDMLGIGINAQSSAGGNTTVTITGLNNMGTPISGAVATGPASVVSLTSFNLSMNAAFKAVAAIRITSTDLVYAFVDNINIANVGTVLPVTFLDFSAAIRNNNIDLNWRTATEQGTTNFVVQHSDNGVNWSPIGTIAAAGNSTGMKAYSFTHTTPTTGHNYYRLAQLDSDGRQQFSTILFYDVKDKSTQLAVYPGLAANGFVNVKLGKRMVVQVFNQAGTVVMMKELQAGVSQLPTGHLPAGVYRIKAGTETGAFIIM